MFFRWTLILISVFLAALLSVDAYFEPDWVRRQLLMLRADTKILLAWVWYKWLR